MNLETRVFNISSENFRSVDRDQSVAYVDGAKIQEYIQSQFDDKDIVIITATIRSLTNSNIVLEVKYAIKN